MGATNYREQLESAFRDRFLRQFEIKNPNFAGRIEILCNQLRHELKGDERVKEYLVGILSKLPILRHLYVLVDQQLAGNTRKHSVKFATFPPGRQLTNVAQNVARFIKDNYFNGRDQQTYTAQSLRFIPQNAWGALFKAALKKASITTTNNPNEFKQEVDKGARKVYSTGDAALIEAYDGLRAIFDESLSDRKENKFIDIPAVSAQELARRSDIFEQVCSKFDKKNPAYAVTKDLVTNDPFAPQASAGFREYVTQLTQSPDFKSIFARSGADFGEGVGNLMLDCIKMIDQAQKAIDVYQDAKMAVYAKYAPDNPEESDDDVADPADVYLEDAASEDGSVEYQDEAEPPLLPSATRTGRSRIVQPEADLSSLPFWPEAMEFLQRYPDVTRIGNEGLIQLANSGASLALLMQDLTSPSSTLAKKFFELIDGKVYLKRDEPLKALMAALRTQVPAL